MMKSIAARTARLVLVCSSLSFGVCLGAVMSNLSGVSDGLYENGSLHTANELELSEYASTSIPLARSTGDMLQVGEVAHDDFLQGLVINTDNVTACVTSGSSLDFKTTGGILVLDHGGNNSFARIGGCSILLTVPSGQIVQLEVIELYGECRCQWFLVDAYDGVTFDFLLNYGGCFSLPNRPVWTFSNMASLYLETHLSFACTFRLNFTAVPESARQYVHVLYTSSTEGYLQTLNMDSGMTYAANMDSWVKVKVPVGHMVMISFQLLDVQGEAINMFGRVAVCPSDSVSLYLGGDSPDDLAWKACREIRPSPDLYDTDAFHVRFVSDWINSFRGFKMLFTFHNKTLLPEKLPDGMWNCSVAYYADFQKHFHCNMHQECAGLEDERDCPYTSDTCGPGLVSIRDRCYLLIMQDTNLPWDDGANLCRRRGAHLASLNTPEEWRDVFGFLEKQEYDVAFGLQTARPTLPYMYKWCFEWSDGTIAYYLHARRELDGGDCGYLRPEEFNVYKPELRRVYIQTCEKRSQAHVLCEKDSNSPADGGTGDIHLATVQQWTSNVSHFRCETGHVTHDFLACDVQSECWERGYDSPVTCPAALTPLPPSFTCANGAEHVPYTLVCDFRSDCRDDSDEDFCVFPPCDFSTQITCGNQQCVAQKFRCDGIEHCVNGADEMRCNSENSDKTRVWMTSPPPARVDFDGRGDFIVTSLNTSDCPETHFRCPGDGYCLPVYVRCNGVYDCPGKEDEAACDSYTCPGFYRCRASRICLHPDHVCDGLAQCPQRDDELVCDLRCPQDCTCYGAAFFCRQPFPTDEYPNLRYLDASGSGMTPEDLTSNMMLVYLSLAKCGLRHAESLTFPNLHSLDLSDNQITSLGVEDLVQVPRLRFISLSNNPITSSFLTNPTEDTFFPSLKVMDVSFILVEVLNGNVFNAFPKLQEVNMSYCGTERVLGQGFNKLKDLQVLDLRGCPVLEFPRDLLLGLDQLDMVYSDNYKLCCPDMLPAGFTLSQCIAPIDEISSCDALLRSDFYRVLLSVFSALALLGNIISLSYRAFCNKVKNKSGFSAFVTHLCTSDFLMGVYLAIIGVADRVYFGRYLWSDFTWKRSTACKLAGFLSLLSSEVSAFIICLITLDRFLVLRFPFSALHFKFKSAHVACLVAWLVGLLLAGLPLLPVTSHWEFYSQSGICIPLPITRKSFPGQDYSFAIMIVLNFILFLLIAVGQVFIYWSIRVNSMSASDSTKKSKDLTIARRLFTVVMSDFLCWFPIGVLGLLASNGVAVPGEVNVAMAIIVLPLNSALNPFLYTVNTILERRRKAWEMRIQRRVMQAQRLSTTLTVSDTSKTENTQAD